MSDYVIGQNVKVVVSNPYENTIGKVVTITEITPTIFTTTSPVAEHPQLLLYDREIAPLTELEEAIYG